MNHDQALLRVEDYAAGRLAEPDATAMRTHLASCALCRDLVSACELAIEADALASTGEGAHPPADVIAAFAVGLGRGGPWTADRVGAHVRVCAPCADDVSRVRDAERSLARPGIRERLAALLGPEARSFLFPALATLAIVALVLVYPIVHGVARLRLQASRIDELSRLLERSGGAGGTGVYPLYVLTGTERGTESSRRSEIRLSGTAVDLAFAPFLPASGTGTDVYHVEIRGQDDRPLWSFALPLASLRRASDVSDGLLPLRVPVAALPAGDARLVEISPGGDVVASFAFTVLAASPGP